MVAPVVAGGSLASGLSASSASHSPTCGAVSRSWTTAAKSVICSARYSPWAGGMMVRSSQLSSDWIEPYMAVWRVYWQSWSKTAFEVAGMGLLREEEEGGNHE